MQEYMQKGLAAVIIRPTAIYGPGDPERFYMLFKMVSRGNFLMFGKGMAFYHPVYIDNLVNAFELAMDKNEAVRETFIIADERYYPIKDIIERIAAVLNIRLKIQYFPFWPLWLSSCVCEAVCAPLRIPPPIFRRRADWFRQNRAFDISKAKSMLGYQPRIGLDEVL